ncbi:unnamed protein product [Dovyalis caffra]|uniref:Uncharacterized protein n=1 Tax=Dovyalis caffra TaxID=77055 RepID=A0AAV1R409_9ROSI|nr:unnamed protein product [Dovyalis caffra]
MLVGGCLRLYYGLYGGYVVGYKEATWGELACVVACMLARRKRLKEKYVRYYKVLSFVALRTMVVGESEGGFQAYELEPVRVGLWEEFRITRRFVRGLLERL